jgi:hypothetical protein
MRRLNEIIFHRLRALEMQCWPNYLPNRALRRGRQCLTRTIWMDWRRSCRRNQNWSPRNQAARPQWKLVGRQPTQAVWQPRVRVVPQFPENEAGGTVLSGPTGYGVIFRTHRKGRQSPSRQKKPTPDNSRDKPDRLEDTGESRPPRPPHRPSGGPRTSRACFIRRVLRSPEFLLPPRGLNCH